MPEDNRPLTREELSRLRALYAGELSPQQAVKVNSELFQDELGRIVSASNYSLGVTNSIFEIVRKPKFTSEELFSEAISAANEKRITDAKSLAQQALDLVDSNTAEAGAIYMFIAQLNLQQGNLTEFKRNIVEQLEKAGEQIPLWKRLGDLGIVYLEGDGSVPYEAVEEVFQLALEEFRSVPTKKKGFWAWIKQLRTRLFPTLFDFIPSEYDEVRLNLLLANSAKRQRHNRRAFSYLEDAKEACDLILVEKQAEYAKFLSDYAFQKLLLSSALGNWEEMKAVVEETKRSLVLAGFNRQLPRSGFDYNTIDRNFIVSAYVFSSQSTKPEKLEWILDGLEAILARLDREDKRYNELVVTIQADLEMIRARQVEFEYLPLVSLKIA